MTEPTPDDTLVLPAELWQPLPQTPAAVAALVRQLLLHWEFPPRTVDAVVLDVEGAAPHLTRLALVASRVEVPGMEDLPPQALPDGPLEELPGTLDELHVVGDDLFWEGTPLSVAAHVRELRFRWLLQDGQLVGVRLSGEDAPGTSGNLRLEAELDSFTEALRRTIDRPLREHGGHLRKLRVDATQLGDRSYRVRVEAALRWKVLPLSARLELAATVDDDLVLRFSDVAASSLNPLCAVVIAFGRRRLAEALAEPVPLREVFGAELTDLTIRLDPRLLIEASFADLR